MKSADLSSPEQYYHKLRLFPFERKGESYQQDHRFEKELDAFLEGKNNILRLVRLNIEESYNLADIIESVFGHRSIYRGFGSVQHARRFDGNLFSANPNTAGSYAVGHASSYGSVTPTLLELNIDNLIRLAEKKGDREPLMAFKSSGGIIALNYHLKNQLAPNRSTVRFYQVPYQPPKPETARRHHWW
jgi:hypothetical protein